MASARHCARNAGVDHCASIKGKSIHALSARVRVFAHTVVSTAGAPSAGVQEYARTAARGTGARSAINLNKHKLLFMMLEHGNGGDRTQ